MAIPLFEQLNNSEHLPESSLQKIKEAEANKLFSLHWELKTILYLGVLLVSGALGILIYKNIDTIGQQAILLILALICVGCFFYCFKKKLPFSKGRVFSPNAFSDYTLLLGCLTFITIIGYLQFQYNVFGNRYGLATFIPMLALFFSAYYFDHLGVLSMAITALAAWAGITVTPTRILQDNDFNSTTIIITSFALGVALMVIGYLSIKQRIKQHFEFTYSNFGAHLIFIAAIAAIINFDNIYLLLFVMLAGVSYFFYTKAIKERSFYYILISSLYFYIGLSYTVVRLILDSTSLDIGPIAFAFLYFIGSAIALIIFLIRTNKKIKAL